MDTAGNLYGVAAGGGAHDYGVVYELTPGSGGSWTEKVLYSFSGGAGGASPSGSLLLDSSGNLFGTATFTAYELVRGSNGRWTEKALHRFVAEERTERIPNQGLSSTNWEISTEQPTPGGTPWSGLRVVSRFQRYLDRKDITSIRLKRDRRLGSSVCEPGGRREWKRLWHNAVGWDIELRSCFRNPALNLSPERPTLKELIPGHRQTGTSAAHTEITCLQRK